jgi:uncharacterized protein (TIGR03437 family)
MVEINVPGASLLDGLAKLGFGSTDIQVRRVWVVSPTRLIANVSVSPNASGITSVSVVNGLQLVTQSNAFFVLPSNPRLVTVFPQAVNPANGQLFVQSGSPALVLVNNLPPGTVAANVALTINDLPAPVTGLNGNQLTFQIPNGLPAGPAVLRLRIGTETSQAVAIAIEPPPPVILSILNGGSPVDTTRPARVGDTITLGVAGLIADAFTGLVNPTRLSISVGGVEHAVQSVAAGAVSGQYQVTFVLTGAVNSGVQTITISQDARVSTSASLPVQR